MKKVTLLKRRSSNNEYLDFFVCWVHNDKFYYVRVRPSFLNDLKLMSAHAVEVPKDEPLQKYC